MAVPDIIYHHIMSLVMRVRPLTLHGASHYTELPIISTQFSNVLSEIYRAMGVEDDKKECGEGTLVNIKRNCKTNEHTDRHVLLVSLNIPLY